MPSVKTHGTIKLDKKMQEHIMTFCRPCRWTPEMDAELMFFAENVAPRDKSWTRFSADFKKRHGWGCRSSLQDRIRSIQGRKARKR